MTNTEKLVEILKAEFGCDNATDFGWFLESHSCKGFKCESPFCGKCSHRDFWKKEVTQRVVELPFVQSKQRMGHWIKKMVRGREELYCSNCGDGIDVIYEYNYCPNCGAEMEEGE